MDADSNVEAFQFWRKTAPYVISVLSFIFVVVWYWFVYLEEEPSAPYVVDIPIDLKPGQYGQSELRNAQGQHSEIHNGLIYPSCPADGRPLTKEPITPATRSSIDDAIARASTAQKTWAQTTYTQRRRVLRSLLAYVLAHQNEIVTAACLDSGKTLVDACFGEILVTVEKLEWTIKHGESALKPSRRPTNLLMCYKRNTVIYQPLGVTAATPSWNYPFHNFISPIISAIFAGNGIIVKPSEQTCWSTLYYLAIVRGALKACGHDPELVQNVICLPDTADYLTSHPGLSHITFIGSREIAHKVCTSAAKALTPVTVELGGKDPAIVLDDAETLRDLESVASILLRGTFQSAGQNCIGIERVIALPNVHDRLLRLVIPQILSLRLGSATLDTNPPDMGSMISSRSFDRLESLISDAVEAGATLHAGGQRLNHPDHPNGHYFMPTLLSGVTSAMAIAQTELFAPVFLLMRAETVDEAISIANSTEYGLGASVFGHSPVDVQKCIQQLKSGMVAVNDFGAYYACSMPFGGVKASGYGRFGGAEGLQALCAVKSVCEDAPWARFLGMRTRIPGVLRYPIPMGRVSWAACEGIVETGYGVGIGQKVRGIVKLLKALMGRPAKGAGGAGTS